MNSNKSTIFCLLILLLYSSFYGQERILKTYLTADSLTVIHLFPNQQFGYTSYQGTSPFTYKHIGSIDGPLFEIAEQGSGKYSVHKDRLKLNFVSTKHPVDSISKISSGRSRATDSLNLKIVIKPYYLGPHIDSELGIGTIITSEDITINLNTMFENCVDFKIGKDELPIRFIVNKKYELLVDTASDQEIELFINPFKTMVTQNPADKVLDLKNLTEVKLD